jgi:hypothetical protein
VELVHGIQDSRYVTVSLPSDKTNMRLSVQCKIYNPHGSQTAGIFIGKCCSHFGRSGIDPELMNFTGGAAMQADVDAYGQVSLNVNGYSTSDFSGTYGLNLSDGALLRIQIDDDGANSGKYIRKFFVNDVLMVLDGVDLTLDDETNIGLFSTGGGEWREFCYTLNDAANSVFCPRCTGNKYITEFADSDITEWVAVKTSDSDSSYSTSQALEGVPSPSREITLSVGNAGATGNGTWHSIALFGFPGIVWDPATHGPVAAEYSGFVKVVDSYVKPHNPVSQRAGSIIGGLGMRQVVDGVPHYYASFGLGATEITIQTNVDSWEFRPSRWWWRSGRYLPGGTCQEYHVGGCSDSGCPGDPVCSCVTGFASTYPNDTDPIDVGIVWVFGYDESFPDIYGAGLAPDFPMWITFRIDQICLRVHKGAPFVV